MKNYNLQELLQKPVCMMQGDEFVFLLSNLSLLGKQETKQVESKPKNLVYPASVSRCSRFRST